MKQGKPQGSYKVASNRLLASSTLDQLASSLVDLGLPILMFTQTGSISSSALVLLSSTVPKLLLSPFAGVLADRFNRQRLVVTINLVRAFILVVITPFLVLTDVRYVAFIAFLISSLYAFERPAALSVLPELFGESYKDFMATRGGLIFAAQTIGPLIAGSMATFLQPTGTLIVAGVVIGVSAVIVLSLKVYDIRPSSDRLTGRSMRVQMNNLRQGFSYAASEPVAAGLLVYWMFSMAAVAMTTLPALAYIQNDLSLPVFYYGLATSIYAGACILSSLSMRFVRTSGKVRIWLIAAGLGYGVVNIVMPLHPPFVVFIILWAAWGLLYGPEQVLSQVAFGRAVASEYSGRVFSLMSISFAGGSLMGYLAVGVLTPLGGPTLSMFIGGCLFMVTSVRVFGFGRSGRAFRATDESSREESASK